MKDNAQHIIEILFGREKLEDVTVNQLKDLVKEYPSFNIGHYLLSKKLQAENDEEFLPETKKTALYINNPFWLQWLLQQINDEPIMHPQAGHSMVHQKGTNRFIYTTEPIDLLGKSNILDKPLIAEETKPDIASFQQPEPEFEQPAETAVSEQPNQIIESSPEPTFEQLYSTIEQTHESAGFVQAESSTEQFLESATFEHPTQTNENSGKPAAFNEVKETSEPSAESSSWEQPEQKVEQPSESTFYSPIGQPIEQPEEKNRGNDSEPIIGPLEEFEDKREPAVEIVPTTMIFTETSFTAQTPEPVHEPVLPTEEKYESTVKIEETKLEEFAFDPYHTIDYFASQGIKFVQEENPSDKLGKQLKSFTDWLKIMKRLPQKAIESTFDESREADVEIIAAHSIEEKDVITEAMAVVFAKQGKNEKAVEIYQKLSLLEPDKSYYFANKIAELKIPNS